MCVLHLCERYFVFFLTHRLPGITSISVSEPFPIKPRTPTLELLMFSYVALLIFLLQELCILIVYFKDLQSYITIRRKYHAICVVTIIIKLLFEILCLL